MNKPSGYFVNVFTGVVLTGVCLIVALLVARVYTFECRRFEPPTNQGKCELISQWMLGKESQSFSIESLEGATVEEIDGENGKVYRVLILTTEGIFPLSQSYSSGQKPKQDLVQEISTFVHTRTQETLLIKQDDRWLFYIVGGVFGCVGVFWIFFVSPRLLR